MTSILMVLIVGGLVLLAVRTTAKQLAEPLHRLAAAKEGENKARAEDLAAIADALRGEFTERVDELGRRVNLIDRDVDGLDETVQGETYRVNKELDRVDHNINRVATVAATAAERAGVQHGQIAGSSWWRADVGDNPLEGRVGQGVTLSDEQDYPQAGGYAHADDQTAVQGAVQDPGPGEYTRDIMAVVGPAQQVVPLSDINDPQEIGKAILALIRTEAPDAHPWTLHPTVQLEGQRCNRYDLARATLMRQHPGCMPPRNMHDLWPNLTASPVWQSEGPREDEMTETSRPLLMPPA